MIHFGIICPAFSGHLNPMAALGRELQHLGHRVTWFGILDNAAKITAEGLNFWSIGHSDFPINSLNTFIAQAGKLSGSSPMRVGIKDGIRKIEMTLNEAPPAVKKAGVEALLIDQCEAVGATIAEFMEIPFVTICNALTINRESSIPPHFTPWGYRNVWWAHFRNQLGYSVGDWFAREIVDLVSRQRQQWKLPPHQIIDDSFSSLAQISQQPPAFDFPRKSLPACFHYTGPFRNSSPQTIPFPYEKLTGQPLVYASLGTIQRKGNVFQCIAEACEELDIQLIIAHGGSLSPDEEKALAGSPLVVSYAPQLELLAQTKLVITHAGLNTVLDALSYGIPIVAIPIAYEQPAIAARLKWTGAGKIIPFPHLNLPRLRTTIEQVLTNTTYSKNAMKLQESIQKAGGVKRAATIVEQAIITRQPVLAKR